MTRSEKWYREVIVPGWINQYGGNPMEVPRLEKVICHIGVGRAGSKKKEILGPMVWLTQHMGQKAIKTMAKTSNASFQVRRGMSVGVKVTYRKEIIYGFLDHWVENVLPAQRDFRGYTFQNWDKNGNVTLSIKEGSLWPLWNPFIDRFPNLRGLGMECTFVTSTPSKSQSIWLLSSFQIPLNNKK
jgi:large subunit ribosomal protein L5